MAKTVCVLGIIACFCLHISDASLCKPNSKFKFDCNTCTCSSSGREFSCTDIICAPIIYKDKYLIEKNEKGYSILKPKNKNPDDNNKVKSNNDLFINENVARNKKFKRSFISMPYKVHRIPNDIIYYDAQERQDENNDFGKFRKFMKLPSKKSIPYNTETDNPDDSLDDFSPNADDDSIDDYDYDDYEYDTDYYNDDGNNNEDNEVTYGKVVPKTKY